MDSTSSQFWLNNNVNVDPFSTSSPIAQSINSSNNNNLNYGSDSINNNITVNNINNYSSNNNRSPFDSMEHARLSPSALDPNSFNANFILPKFLNTNSMLGYDLNIAEPERALSGQQYEDVSMSRTSSFSSFYRNPTSPALNQPSSTPIPSTSTATPSTNVSVASPIYGPYGTSIIAVNPLPLPSAKIRPYTMHPFTITSSTSSSIYPPPAPFDPAALNLPLPPIDGSPTNFAGLYSSSGFDLLSVLARVASRPNPTLIIGPVDTSASFVVVDARKYDLPIVFASEAFETMTGYKGNEIIGKNCRFLQSPDGKTPKGIPRKFTDDAAAYHMRSHIISGKESQCSLINYKKDGTPFINLVTIIPIAWDSQEVAYFFGLSCDLVAQPAAILDRMKEGIYVVNYSLLAANTLPNAVALSAVSLSASSALPSSTNLLQHFNKNIAPTTNSIKEEQVVEIQPIAKISTNLNNESSVLNQFELSLNNSTVEHETLDLIDTLIRNGGGSDAFSEISERNRLFTMVLDNSNDLIHVVSLKGSLLYCSPSTSSILEYDPSEIIGKTFQAICHPSDIAHVMRELKDAGNSSTGVVSLLYRIRRKYSGYIWIESIGRVHVEPGKTRKSLILLGRPREVYKMSWNELRKSGGIGELEFWSKLSKEGMVLNCTSSVESLLGFSMTEMVGTSLFQLVKDEYVKDIRAALLTCSQGSAVSVQYKTKTRGGFVDVVTRFYPREVDALENLFSPPTQNSAPTHLTIIAQTNELSSEERKLASAFAISAPAYSNNSSDGASPDSELEELNFTTLGAKTRSNRENSTASAMNLSNNLNSSISNGSNNNMNGVAGFNLPLLSYKNLMHPSLVSDNLFDELDTVRCNSWQFEYNQLQMSNTKLKDEIDFLKRGQLEFQLRKAKDLAAAPPVNLASNRPTHVRSVSSGEELPNCHNCGEQGLPIGRTLCDTCALLNTSDEGGLEGAGFSPMSIENSASPVGWR